MASYDHYSPIFDNNPYKVAALTVSPLAMIAVNSMLYGIVWYERYGNHRVRTLLNQLVASLCWYCMLYSLLTQPLDMILFLHGPLPHWLCSLSVLVKKSLSGCGLMTVNAITLIRYIFIFHMKNPVALDDSFFCAFINLVNIVLHILFHGGFQMARDTISMNTYVCTGLDPAIPRKQNKTIYHIYPNGSMILKDENDNQDIEGTNGFQIILRVGYLITILFHIYVGVKVYLLRKKDKSLVHPENGPVLERQNSTAQQPLKTIADFAINFAIFAVGGHVAWTVLKLDRTGPNSIVDFPNYLLVYGAYLINPNLIFLTIGIMYYARHKSLRETVFKEIRDLLSNDNEFAN